MAHQLIDQPAGRRRGRGCGCVAIAGAVSFLAICGGGLYFFIVAMQGVGLGMVGMSTEPLPMDASRFDPWAALPAVTEKAGNGARLVSIRASSVRRDGTVDLTAEYSPPPRVTYEFVRPAQGKTGPEPPIGAGRKPGDVWIERVEIDCYRPGQTGRVRQTGRGGNVSVTYRNRGMMISVDDPTMGTLPPGLPPPPVSLRDMWDRAVKDGRPEDAVATIQYNPSELEFWIPGVGSRLEWSPDGTPR